MKNLRKLEQQVKSLTKRRDSSLSMLTDTSDKTRARTANIENGMYIGQMALSIFRNLTNQHLTARKRFVKVAITLGTFLLATLARKYFIKKKV